jgi:hypothetical protein
MPEKTRKKAKKRRKKAKKKKAKKAPTASAAPTPDLPKVSGPKLKVKRRKPTRRQPQTRQEDRIPQTPEIISEFTQHIKNIRKSHYIKKLLGMPEPVKYTLLFVAILFTLALMGMVILPILIALTSHNQEEVVVESEMEGMGAATTTSTSSTMTSTTSTSSSTSVTSTTQQQIVCTSPYIRFGLGCCLDTNNNSICDPDEPEETTTTTLADYIRCFNDLDCGPTRVEYKCVENDLFRVSVTHFCRNAGSRASSCETHKVEDLVDYCKPHQQCYISSDGSGRCKDRYAPSNFL